MVAPGTRKRPGAVIGEREERYLDARQRARASRWNAIGRARVEHRKHGVVVVPHSSNLAAVMNAAEYWGCEWSEITDAEVWAAEPGDGPAVKPKEFCGQTRKRTEEK